MEGRRRMYKRGRHRTHRCGKCGAPATYRTANGRDKARADHPLCTRCFEALMEENAAMAARMLREGWPK